MWNEESFLAVDNWRQFLNEQTLPPEKPLDVEDILPPPSPIEPTPIKITPIKPGAPPSEKLPTKPPPRRKRPGHLGKLPPGVKIPPKIKVKTTPPTTTPPATTPPTTTPTAKPPQVTPPQVTPPATTASEECRKNKNKCTPAELYSDLELAKKHYKVCRENPDLCTKRKILIPDVYEKPIILSKEDIPERLDITLTDVIYTWADDPRVARTIPDPMGKGKAWDSKTSLGRGGKIIKAARPLTDNFANFIRREGSWQPFVGGLKTWSGGVRIKSHTPNYAWGSVRTILPLYALAHHLGDTDAYPLHVRNISLSKITGEYYKIGGPWPPGQHVSHKWGMDVDIGIAVDPKKYKLGYSVTEKGRFLPHKDKRVIDNFDLERNWRIVEFFGKKRGGGRALAKNIFLWSGLKKKLVDYAKAKIRNKEITKQYANSILGKISDGCARGKKRCRSHDNHYHIRFYGKDLTAYEKLFAPWHHTPGKPLITKAAMKAVERAKKRTLRKYLKASGKPFTEEELKALEKSLDVPPEIRRKHEKYRARKKREKERARKKLKEYLNEQGQPPMDPAMMDPAAQRLQMQKQAIQMGFGPMRIQADDMIFTLNSLGDERATATAGRAAPRIEFIDQQFHDGKLDPEAAMKKLGPIVDELGKAVNTFMTAS